MKLSSNPVFHARTKPIELYYHFIREKVEEGENNWHNRLETKLGKGPYFLYLREAVEREKETVLAKRLLLFTDSLPYRLRPAIPEKRPNKTFF